MTQPAFLSFPKPLVHPHAPQEINHHTPYSCTNPLPQSPPYPYFHAVRHAVLEPIELLSCSGRA